MSMLPVECYCCDPPPGASPPLVCGCVDHVHGARPIMLRSGEEPRSWIDCACALPFADPRECFCVGHEHAVHEPTLRELVEMPTEEFRTFDSGGTVPVFVGIDFGVGDPYVAIQRALARVTATTESVSAVRRAVLLRTLRASGDPLPFRRIMPPYRDTRALLPKGR